MELSSLLQKARACFQNVFAYLLAKTAGSFVTPRSRLSKFSTASRLAPGCFGCCIQAKPF